ncbi:CACNA1A isoform 2 [Pan troglodytes]|uniref:CACNA1A isoform 2 n=4 Tax=Homininae TaxID=207598 RepID=A0A6D2XIQ8_PANTR|nr:CACNA1A isoform 2 [Pan troglodytes]
MSSWPTRPTKSTAPPRPGGKNGRSYQRMCFTQTRE